MFFFAFWVFWGKKKTEKQLGYAADFCPICRRISAFRINRVGVAAHVYYVALDDGQFVGHSQQCVTCMTNFNSNPNRFDCLADTPDGSVELLAEATFPSIDQVFAERLALEERIARDPHALDPELRSSVLMEGFNLAASYFENRAPETGMRILIAALKPLAPSEEEVRDCLNHFRRIRAPIGGMVRTSTVMKKITWKPLTRQYEY